MTNITIELLIKKNIFKYKNFPQSMKLKILYIYRTIKNTLILL